MTTSALPDVVSNRNVDGELSERNVNQANAMLSLPPCTVPVDINIYTKIGSRLPLRNAGIGAESDDVRRVQKMGPDRRVIQNAIGEASY